MTQRGAGWDDPPTGARGKSGPSRYQLEVSPNGKFILQRARIYDYSWSPNGRWIAYFDTEFYKARSGSVLWEMDAEEALAKVAK